jgi:hypothetical protein
MAQNGFLIFTLVCDFLLPVLMLLGGALFLFCTPKKVNGWYGYRTRLSMRTKETWRFAHRYFGRRWLIFGGVELGVTIGAVLAILFAGGGEALEGWSLVCMTVQLVGLVLPIAPTEKALRTQFDRYGCPVTPKAERLSRENLHSGAQADDSDQDEADAALAKNFYTFQKGGVKAPAKADKNVSSKSLDDASQEDATVYGTDE